MKKIQNFTVSHLNQKDFKGGGLRKYSKYRDLGIAKATNGLAHAQVIKMIPPRTNEVSVWHQHDVEFQLIYVLEGWIMSEFDDSIDFLVVCEGDCIIEVPIEEFVNKVESSYQIIEDNKIGYMSFGDVKTLEHGWLQSTVKEFVPVTL